MTIQKIECFLMAAETLNFTEAADRLYITQPVLSRQILSMEQELGFDLFVRKKKITLTKAGVALARDFSKVFFDYQQAIKKASTISRSNSSVIRIGIYDGQSLIDDPRIAILKMFQQTSTNDIKYVYSKNSIMNSSRLLKDGSIDLVLGCSYDYENDSSFDIVNICDTKSYIVASKSHPLANIENPSLKDFQNEKFLVLSEEESPKCLRDLTACFRRAGLEPPTFVPVPDVGTRSLWLMAGEGVMVETRQLDLFGNDSFRFVYVPEIGSIPMSFIWRKENNALEGFSGFLKNGLAGALKTNV